MLEDQPEDDDDEHDSARPANEAGILASRRVATTDEAEDPEDEGHKIQEYRKQDNPRPRCPRELAVEPRGIGQVVKGGWPPDHLKR